MRSYTPVFHWPNIAATRDTVFLMSRCVVWLYAVEKAWNEGNFRLENGSRRDSVLISSELRHVCMCGRRDLQAHALLFNVQWLLRSLRFVVHWKRVINLKRLRLPSSCCFLMQVSRITKIYLFIFIFSRLRLILSGYQLCKNILTLGWE